MRVSLTFMALMILASQAHAQIACTGPDDLCTGDPCVIGTVAVQSPCTVDFGNRALEIAGTVSVPDGGSLHFEARYVHLAGRIDGRHAGTGAHVTLASPGFSGSIHLDGVIDVSGDAASGTIDVVAPTDVRVTNGLHASSKLGTGGSIVVVSGGEVAVDGVLDVRGTDGGSIFVAGKQSASAFPELHVVVGGKCLASGREGAGGSVTLRGSNVRSAATLDVRGNDGDGGTVEVTGARNVSLDSHKKILASGTASGGTVSVSAQNGQAFVAGKVMARGRLGDGGTVATASPNGMVIFIAKSDLRGGMSGGHVRIDGDSVDLERVRAIVSGGAGGDIRVNQTGTEPVVVGGVERESGVSGGGLFDARPSGTIEILAPAASVMIASGRYLAGPAGCVGLSSGGSTDTTGVTSDVPLSPNCP